MPEVGNAIAEAMDRFGFRADEVAKKLGVERNTVYSQRERPTARRETLARYAEAFTRLLAERGDRRRFTAEILARGGDPEPLDRPAIDMPHRLAATFISGLQLLRTPEDLEVVPAEYTVLPFWGDIPCGEPVILDDHPQSWIPVLTDRLGRGMDGTNTIVFRAAGQSMQPTVEPGDLLLVRTDVDWSLGSVVVVNLDDEGRATLKRVARGPTGWYLEPDNQLDRAIAIDAPTVRIVGVARRVMKDIELP